MQHFVAIFQKECGYDPAAGVKIHRPVLNGKPKLSGMYVWDKTKKLKSKAFESEGKGLLFKTTAHLMNKEPQISAYLQVVHFYLSLTLIGSIQKMAHLGSPCSSQVEGIMSRVKGSLSRTTFIFFHLKNSPNPLVVK